MKIPNERVLHKISKRDFIKIHKECTAEPYSFLVHDAMLTSDNPLRFRKNLFNLS